jgi:hypothetical protein
MDFLTNFLPQGKKMNDVPNLPTAWSRMLPEKLTGPQLLNIFPECEENRRFITAFTKYLDPSLV